MGGGGRKSKIGEGGEIEEITQPIIDTRDISGEMLRKVVIELDDKQREERRELQEKVDTLKNEIEIKEKAQEIIRQMAAKDVGYKIAEYNSEELVDKFTKQKEKLGYYRLEEEINKLRMEHTAHKDTLKMVKQAHVFQQRELFITTEGVNVTMKPSAGVKAESRWEKMVQAVDYVQKLWKPVYTPSKVEKAEALLGRKFSEEELKGFVDWEKVSEVKKDFSINIVLHKNIEGGSYFTHKNEIAIGKYAMGGSTAAHEVVHFIEDVTEGAREKRSKFMKEYIEKKLGKPIEEVELKMWQPYDEEMLSESQKRYYRNYYKDTSIVAGLLSREDEKEWGYMLKVYVDTTKNYYEKAPPGKKRTKKYIRKGAELGEEMLTVGIEKIYTEPAEFARKFPEIFDFQVDLMRGKI